jgi:hypothetical protein
MAAIARDAHISGTSRSDDHRVGSRTTREGSCDVVDIAYTSFLNPLLTQGRLGAIGVGPDRDCVKFATGSVDRGSASITEEEKRDEQISF